MDHLFVQSPLQYVILYNLDYMILLFLMTFIGKKINFKINYHCSISKNVLTKST